MPWRLVAAAGFVLALVLSARVAAFEPTVVILSWDGVRPDYLDRVVLPAIGRMRRDGARAERLEPVFPTLTFPNHVTLATGVPADRHGIVANVFRTRDGERFDFDNDATWIEAEPLWVAAERQGVRTAVFFWVGSESDWRGVGATYRRTPFDSRVGEPAKVAQLLAWLDLPPAQRPRLLMSWWHGADAAGHRYGPDSPRIAEALREQDEALSVLLAGLDARNAWPDVTLLLVSDHGMTAVAEALDLAPVLAGADIDAEIISSGEGVASIWLEQPAQRAAALAALADMHGIRAYPSDGVPPALRYRLPARTGDIVAIAEPPHFFTTARTSVWERILFALGRQKGAHGYDPSHPDMAAIFLALGRGVRPGTRLPSVRAVDVAPTAAHLLGIAPPRDAEGRRIDGVGDDPGIFTTETQRHGDR